MNLLKQLNRWHWQEKGHAVKVDIETTYGATCWTCELYNVDTKQMVTVSEVSFFGREDGTVPYIIEIPDDCKDVERWMRGYTQFYAHVNEGEWSGPNEVIQLALLIAEKEGV